MRHEPAAESIERVVDAVAAIALAAASGFASFALLGGPASTLAASIVTGLAAWLGLQRIEAAPMTHHLPHFLPASAEFADPADELVLTEEMAIVAANELLLDDILEELGPESRVVRLFARPAPPTAGELSDSIDRHLNAGPDRFQAPDASDALLNALADLRRSLR